MPFDLLAYSVPAAAEACSVSPETIKRAIRSGRLRAKRSGEGGGGKFLIRHADLEAWLEELGDA